MGKKNKQKSIISKQSRSLPFQLIFWSICIVAVGLVVFMVMSNNQTKKDEKANAETITIDYDGQPDLGDSAATVQIVEFGDYKCPYCKNFLTSFFPAIKSDFIDTNKAQFYFMNDDFISIDSTRSAEFAEVVYKELGNDMYWEFHKLLYSKQPEDQQYERADYFTENFLIDTLKEIASVEEVEIVTNSFHEGNGKEPLAVDKSYVEMLQVESTPTLFVNGKQFTGNSYEEFVKMVEDALKEQ